MRSVRTVVAHSSGSGSDLSPPPSSFGVDLARLSEPRFFCFIAIDLYKALTSVSRVE